LLLLLLLVVLLLLLLLLLLLFLLVSFRHDGLTSLFSPVVFRRVSVCAALISSPIDTRTRRTKSACVSVHAAHRQDPLWHPHP
jgi:hypothetical protein